MEFTGLFDDNGTPTITEQESKMLEDLFNSAKDGNAEALNELIKIVEENEKLSSDVIHYGDLLNSAELDKIVCELIHKSSEQLLDACCYYAGARNLQELGPKLIEILKVDDKVTIKVAATALAKLDFQDAIPQLIKNLQHPDGDTRWICRQALGHIRKDNGYV